MDLHLPPLFWFGRYQQCGGTSHPGDGDCTQSVGWEPDLGRSAHTASPGQCAAYLLATGQGRLWAHGVTVACAQEHNLGHCARRGLSRANPLLAMPELLTFADARSPPMNWS